MSSMTDLKTIVAQRLKELDLKPVPAADAVGLERGFIRDIIVGRKKSVSSDKMPLLAKALQLDPASLAAGIAQPAQIPNKGEVQPANVSLPARHAMPRDVPVVGTAAGSLSGRGAFQITPDVIDYVARPPGLAQARDVYALYVEGDSMEPRFMAGDLLFVHPHKPVRVGDVVIIQEPDETRGSASAYVKIFIRRTENGLVAEQLNPVATIEFKRNGLTIHKVLTMNELFGV